MITIVRPDLTVSVHKGPCLLCPSKDCPGEPCCGDQGGKCVIAWDGTAVECLASYPPGISYSDCSCEHSPCDHAKQLLEQTLPPDQEHVDHRQQIKEKAKAAYEERMAQHGTGR